MAQITEVAPDLFRITTFIEPFNMQFSQFLVRDEERFSSIPARGCCLAALSPKTLATTHGSAVVGDGSQALLDLATMFHGVLDPSDRLTQ